MTQLTSSQQAGARDLLADLVRIPSVNESREQADREQAERRVSQFIEMFLAEIGMSVARYPLSPGRDNLVASWPQQSGDASFALQAHMDTVGTANMTVDPFGAEIRDGRMWGRGTCDTKGSMAAFLAALKIAAGTCDTKGSMAAFLAALKIAAGWGCSFGERIHFVATAGEETGCLGAAALGDAGFHVDTIVVGEPTRCRLVTATKGVYWAELSSTGKSCHASMPHLGHNAVFAMAKALRFIEEQYIPNRPDRAHPLLGRPTLSVGTIQGGVATNIVPADCRATLDFRILPGQDAGALREDFLSRLAAAVPDEQFDLADIHVQAGMDTPLDQPRLGSLLAACEARTGQNRPEGVHFYADSGPFHAAGITSVLFGPGDIAQAHTANEFLDLDQLYLAAEIALDWLEHLRC
jgi:acetylornithine deacetylase